MDSRIQILVRLKSTNFVTRRQSGKSINFKGLCCDGLAVLSQFKSLLSVFTHKQNAFVELWRRYQQILSGSGALTVTMFLLKMFAGMAWKQVLIGYVHPRYP